MIARPRLGAALTFCGLFAFATSAAAECAWVLWENVEDFNAVRSYRDTTWTILKTYDVLAECRADHAKLLTGDTSWVPYKNKERIDGGFYVRVDDKAGKTIRTLRYRALCVPGALDPRPKER